MTYAEYDNLQVGDVVYYVNVRYQKMTIEPRKIVAINDFMWFTPYMEDDSDKECPLKQVDRHFCFLNLDEASRCLEACVNHQEYKRRKNYDLAPKSTKQKYVYALTTITI